MPCDWLKPTGTSVTEHDANGHASSDAPQPSDDRKDELLEGDWRTPPRRATR